MSCIEITRDHNLHHNQVTRLVERVMLELADEYSIEFKREGDKIFIQHAHTRGYLHAGRGHIRIKLKIGLLLLPISVTLKKSIENTLDELLLTDLLAS